MNRNMKSSQVMFERGPYNLLLTQSTIYWVILGPFKDSLRQFFSSDMMLPILRLEHLLGELVQLYFVSFFDLRQEKKSQISPLLRTQF